MGKANVHPTGEYEGVYYVDFENLLSYTKKDDETGTYNNFVRCVNEKVDWDNLFTRMGEMENEAISDAIDAVAREKGIELENE